MSILYFGSKIMCETYAASFGFNLETSSDVEPGTSLGGSAAPAVSIIGAFNYFATKNNLNRYAIVDVTPRQNGSNLTLRVAGKINRQPCLGGLIF